jgi:hypothetical protein
MFKRKGFNRKLKEGLKAQRFRRINEEVDSEEGPRIAIIDPSIFDAGLWIPKAKREAILEEKHNNDPQGREFNELSATDYLERRPCPILIIYPID